MSDSKSPLDAVEEGPASSDGDDSGAQASTGSPDDHPTVAALLEAFPDEVQRYRLNAGDQYVVWIRPDRSHEILAWLKNDPEHLYDMMSDVTGVDYGGGLVSPPIYVNHYQRENGTSLVVTAKETPRGGFVVIDALIISKP